MVQVAIFLLVPKYQIHPYKDFNFVVVVELPSVGQTEICNCAQCDYLDFEYMLCK